MKRIFLDEDWQLKSSSDIDDEEGESASCAGFDAKGWYSARLPATVLGALIEAGVYEDPFEQDAWLRLPGLGPPHENFSNHPFPQGSPFAVPWWYRREFELLGLAADDQIWLHFEGINYRGTLFVNGRRVAGPEQIVGAYRTYEFRVTDQIAEGRNALALRVSPPAPDDLALTWVDWNPSPPDKNMGLWRRSWLRRTGPLALFDPHVVSRLTPNGAELDVFVDVENASSSHQQAELSFDLGGRRFSKALFLSPRERLAVRVGADEEAALRLARPRLWWPRRLGARELYDLDVEVRCRGRLSDRQTLRFGVREITCELDEREHALFRVNGRPLLVRGGGWANDLFLRRNPERERREYEYVKHIGLNAIRFEGMLPDDDFLDRCDADGVLVIAGFCCCDHWEKWGNWKTEDRAVAALSLRSQVRRLRHHASLASFWYGSDFPPPREVEECYLAVLEAEHWPNPAHSSAAAKPTELTGPSGLKMAGPYDYVPPSYWHDDEERGGAFGFATEVSSGPAIPPLESLRRMLGESHLWPADDTWTLHAGGGPFKSLAIFDEALAHRYGAPRSLVDYAAKAQLSAYESERAMFEAYSERKYRATGVVKWMLNNAWPSLIWHLWDHCLRPGGGYFGAKKACEPLHVQYSPGTHAVVVVSELWEGFNGVAVEASVHDLDSRELWRARRTVDVPEDAVVRALELPELGELPALFFLKLSLTLKGERFPRSSNFYWLPREPDTLDHENASWITTPIRSYTDLRGLEALAPATLLARAERTRVEDGELEFRVTLENPGRTLAFFNRLRLLCDGTEVLPVLWDENFVSLLPGESLVVSARASGARGDSLTVEVSGRNSPPVNASM